MGFETTTEVVDFPCFPSQDKDSNYQGKIKD